MPRTARQSPLFPVAFLLIATAAFAQKVYTVAGGFVGDGRPATAAAISDPQYAVFDAKGNLYISDYENNRIRRVDTTGIISTVVGNGLCGFTGDGGPANKAEICGPLALLFDSAGDLYFSDNDNSRVRMITAAGIISTVAGNGTFGYCGDGGSATKACLNYPSELALRTDSGKDTLYIADTYNCRIRQVNLTNNIIQTTAGNGTCGYAGDGGPATEAELNNPYGLAYYSATSSLMIADTQNNVIRRFNPKDNIIVLYYGTPGPDCEESISDLCFPEGLTFDSSGNLYVADSANARILEIGQSVTQLVGFNYLSGFNGDGIPATSALLNFPGSIALDQNGNLFTVDSANNRIRKGMGAADISTVAGGYIGDGGPATKASLNASIFENNAIDAHGNLYIADALDHRIRKVASDRTITTFAGTGISGYTGDGGPATQAELNFPGGVAVDRSGDVFIADTRNSAIRKVATSGQIGIFSNAVVLPTGMAFDAKDNLFVADYGACVIWEFNPSGVESIFAGVQYQCGYNSDGIPATQAYLNLPTAVAVDPSTGLVYIADFLNDRIRVVAGGFIYTAAGDGTCGFGGDGGPATSAMLCDPSGVAVDAHSNFYIADLNNLRIREVTNGTINTVAGTGNYGYNGEGTPSLETNMEPTSVLVDPHNDLIYWDLGSYRVRAVH